jgi:AraC family transcriptional regulator
LFRDAVGQAVLARLLELDRNAPALLAHGLPPASVTRVLEYLHAHLAEDLSVEDLSSVAGLRPAHFSTLFRTTFGEPPHQHVLRLRVERARELLEHGADPSAAALTVGFYDQSHLARHMRRFLGVTPGRIARASRHHRIVQDAAPRDA